jgi:hypothetical protein
MVFTLPRVTEYKEKIHQRERKKIEYRKHIKSYKGVTRPHNGILYFTTMRHSYNDETLYKNVGV